MSVYSTRHHFPPVKWTLSTLREVKVGVIAVPLGIACHAGHCCGSQQLSQLGMTNNWFRPLADCIAPPSIIKANPQRGWFEINSHSNPPCPMSKVCDVFSDRDLPSTSGAIHTHKLYWKWWRICSLSGNWDRECPALQAALWSALGKSLNSSGFSSVFLVLLWMAK